MKKSLLGDTIVVIAERSTSAFSTSGVTTDENGVSGSELRSQAEPPGGGVAQGTLAR